MAVANGLYILHDLHLKLKAIQDELERAPRQIKIKENLAAKRQTELDEAKTNYTNQRKLADSKNLQLKTNESKLNDLGGKLNSCNSNREYDILKGQIAADQMANSVLEDEILDCMEQADKLKVKITEADHAVAEAKALIKKISDDASAAEAGLKERAVKLRLAVTEAETVLPTEIVPTYRRLVAAFGADALASVENGVCQACYVSFSPQKGVELRTGKFVFCNCGKLVYVQPSA